ncbi:putative acyltransferase [Hoeflea phototrophica DFL-43]|uniref:Putative acyltransferase n=1 Tax=Hoeflea phototrophica (strain DSM 17068 / NCIMB 14078 / DFL-43) TaxID=411684 RepID=A9D975_HOEPD|nr:acyltransferase [Hoeflea phototrophica]EDQ32872.1 putative acyltransferase [Hoeflea phototrophica DFL-43]
MRNPTSNDKQGLSGDRNGLLDLLRFGAALMLVLYHFLYRGAAEGGYLIEGYGAAGDAISLGYLGVNLFFMISGYVIIWSASGRDWYGFAVGRVARLYPAHLVAMTITALATAWWAQAPMTTDLGHWIANLTMLAPMFGQPFMDGAYWSIVIEIIFYGWVMIGLFTGVLPRHTDLAVAAWLALICLNNLLIGSRPAELLFLTEYGAYFALGAMAWRLTGEGVSALRLTLAAVALAMTFQAAEVQRLDLLVRIGEAGSAAQLALGNLAIVAVFLGAVLFGRFVSPKPWGLALGGISYPLYLIHQNAGYILINVATPGVGKWIAVALATVVSLGVSWWIYSFVEPRGRSIVRSLFHPAARFLPRTGRSEIVPAE